MDFDGIVIDLETNGLYPKFSIIQFSALLLKRGKVVSVINRYYFPKEELNIKAVNIHGLTTEKISTLRDKQGIKYARYFEEDLELLDFLNKVLKKGFLISYNVKFERAFLEFRGLEINKVLDVMLMYTDIVKIRHPYYGYKFPKLVEVLDFLNLPYQGLHNGLVDAYFTYKLLRLYPFLVEPFQGSWKFWEYFYLSRMCLDYPSFLCFKKYRNRRFRI